MVSWTVELEDDLAEAVRTLAAAQHRSEREIVQDALAAYAQAGRPRPQGIGKYHSGCSDVSESAEDVLRGAVKEGRWP
jgi:hypothetical protein